MLECDPPHLRLFSESGANSHLKPPESRRPFHDGLAREFPASCRPAATNLDIVSRGFADVRYMFLSPIRFP